jgi:hypothetical protein
VIPGGKLVLGETSILTCSNINRKWGGISAYTSAPDTADVILSDGCLIEKAAAGIDFYRGFRSIGPDSVGTGAVIRDCW